MREVIRSALKKCPEEIKEKEKVSNIRISSKIWIKMGDVIEVEMQMDKLVSDKETNEMQRGYFIRYSLDVDEITSFSYDEEYDEDWNYNIYNYISDSVKSDIGVTEYEIFNWTHVAKINLPKLE